ncbi:SURF1 family protein [Leucobacter denitrificans]|uniref:SURF1-like protein n=1 Tax=Leucobacter denitrificans TaxID=683042 RepID=A0A7G9S5U8_9MICO|nr:SURF1 family protein [Leucobacter denitrificans]QNN63223.1 SURF1 family protein [Leucobacter denitrificans]
MSDVQVGWTFLRSRRWIGYFALFVVFSIACVYLGNWQFDRRAEARAEIDRIDRNYDAPAVDLRTALPELDKFDEDEQKWLSVTMTGSYLGEAVLARNRPGPSGVGANIIDAFLTHDGRIFFVDRGWILANGTEIDEALTALPARPQGEVTVVARLRASEPEIAGRSATGLSVASINLSEIAEVLDLDGEVMTGAYGMLISETPSGEHGVLPPRPERDEGPHLSYALQWYVFIIIAGIGVAYAARQEYKNLNAGSEQVREMSAKQAERRRRRGLSDADEEDALLDA